MELFALPLRLLLEPALPGRVGAPTASSIPVLDVLFQISLCSFLRVQKKGARGARSAAIDSIPYCSRHNGVEPRWPPCLIVKGCVRDVGCCQIGFAQIRVDQACRT